MAAYNIQIEDSAGNKYYPRPDLLTTKEQVSANTASGKSADALVVKGLINNLTSHPQFIYDSSGKITGYKTKAGADTVFPFNGGNIWFRVKTSGSYPTVNITLMGSTDGINWTEILKSGSLDCHSGGTLYHCDKKQQFDTSSLG